MDDVISAILAFDRALERGDAYDVQRILSRATPGDLSRVYKAFASELSRSPNEEQRRELAARIRTALSTWDAMVICADLAATRPGSRHPINDRMRAIAEEPFFWDARILTADLSLYKRTKAIEDVDSTANAEQPSAAGTPQRSKEANKTLPLQHCFALRLPSDPKERDRIPRDAHGNYGPSYRDLLRAYMEENGSSIDLDGHITRDPRFANKGEAGTTRDDDVDHEAEVFVSSVDAEFKVTIGKKALEKSSLGDDGKFILDVVERAFGLDIIDQPILHFMEGIDKNFAVEAEREGITAHMFLVYKHPPDVQETSELARNMQLLLLRFCAYYMDDEASKKEQVAKEEGARANNVANAAQRARTELRDLAQKVQQSIKELTTRADDMEASMRENPDVSRFILWLKDITPLFKTGVPLPLPGVSVDVLGNHNAWSHEQLAAALWSYTRLEPPSHLSEKDAQSIVAVWNAAMMNLSDDEIQSRLPRMIVHRHGTFQSMRKVSKEYLDNIFQVMKRWNNTAAETFRESGAKSQFYISQLLFLLGHNSFFKLDEKKESQFDFVSQTMVEGLVHFANNIDRGLSDDKLAKTLLIFGEERAISGGLTGVKIEISESENDKDEGKDAIDQPVRYLGPEHLIVRLWQKEVLSARGAQTQAQAAETAANSFANLLKIVAGKQELERVGTEASWRDDWDKGGKQETTTNLAKALGISEKYVDKDDAKQIPNFARVGLSEHWLRVYVDIPCGDEPETTIAMVRCYPDQNLYEFRFRRKSNELRFAAAK